MKIAYQKYGDWKGLHRNAVNSLLPRHFRGKQLQQLDPTLATFGISTYIKALSISPITPFLIPTVIPIQ